MASRTSKITTWDPAKKKVVLVGELRNGILFRKVKPEHFMKVVGGYGIQEVAFQTILERQIKKIVLSSHDREWTSKVKDWSAHGHIADYGSGKQRFLSMKYMTSKKLENTSEDWLKAGLI